MDFHEPPGDSLGARDRCRGRSGGGAGLEGWRGPGAHIPGVIVAGTFHHEGDRIFWDVHDPAKAMVIHLADERYARLVIGVDDPAATVAAIRRALGTGGA